MSSLVAEWSKDPSTKVGAVIVDPETNIVQGMGYNGFPRGVEDSDVRYSDRALKYSLVVHAEANAILNASGSVRGSWIFINVPTCCQECTKLVIQSGIKGIITPKFNNSTFDKRWEKQDEASGIMKMEAGIKHIRVNYENET